MCVKSRIPVRIGLKFSVKVRHVPLIGQQREDVKNTCTYVCGYFRRKKQINRTKCKTAHIT